MKEQKEHLGKGKRMSEKEQEMTSKKLGIHVGDSFQDTREIREVLDKSVFREEEPMHGSRAEVLEEPVTTATSEPESEPVVEEASEPKQEQTLSRMSRHVREAAKPVLEETATKSEVEEEPRHAHRQWKRPVPVVIPLICSILLSLLHVGLPFLTRFATNQQSQNLYAGWAMTRGQAPFGDFYGTNGFLYYVINWLGSLAGGHWILVMLQAVALFYAGTSLYQMVRLLVANKATAQNVQLLFYFLLLALGFGGTYVTFFSLPVLFASMNLILAYFIGHRKDEAFVVYGAMAAIAFLIEPMTSALFYLLAFLGLTAFNIKQKR